MISPEEILRKIAELQALLPSPPTLVEALSEEIDEDECKNREEIDEDECSNNNSHLCTNLQSYSKTYKKCYQNFTDYFRDFGGSPKHIKNVTKISRIISVILVGPQNI